MAARQTDVFTVSRPDDLDELERRLAEEDLDELTLDVPEGATTLFTAREFRRLASAARAAGVVLRIASDDPLRRELARIIGLPVIGGAERRTSSDAEPAIAAETAAPGASAAKDVDAPTRRIDVPASAADGTAPVDVPLSPWRGLDTARGVEDDEVDDGSWSFVITPPTRPAPDRTEDLDASWAAWASRSFETAGEAAPRRRRRSRRGPRLVAAILALLVVAAVLLAVVAPAATIAISPQVEVVQAQVSYGLALPGSSFDVQIAPTTVSTTLTATVSIPTTGERFVPDATATGSLLLTNPSTAEVFIGAGTVATDASGAEYVTTTDVVVPAADPYGSMTFGSVATPVRAAMPGADGNADAETIYGQWDTGVFYTNRDPISGGTMKRIATVSDADRAALEATARADLDARVANALAGLVPAGATLLPGSEQRGETTLRFDHAAGEDATALRIDATLLVTAQIFDPEAMRAQAAEEVTRRLSASAGDGEILDGSIEVGEPQPLGESAADGFTITAQAHVERPVDRAALDALRERAGGADVSDVVAEARQVHGVEAASVDRHNSWLWTGMPLLMSRITIEVQGAQTTVPAEATPAGP